MTTDTGLSDAQENAGMKYVKKLVGSGELAQRITMGHNGEYYLEVREEEFIPLTATLATRKCVLIGLFCAEGFSPVARFSLFGLREEERGPDRDQAHGETCRICCRDIPGRIVV